VNREQGNVVVLRRQVECGRPCGCGWRNPDAVLRRRRRISDDSTRQGTIILLVAAAVVVFGPWLWAAAVGVVTPIFVATSGPGAPPTSTDGSVEEQDELRIG
jgi:hypothetical protein